MTTRRKFNSDEDSRRKSYSHSGAKDSNFNPAPYTDKQMRDYGKDVEPVASGNRMLLERALGSKKK